ncbi:hypothetical protein QBC39DRAFT_359285 [Podospora conica]|nr:hypothetical protein QBC39DRAFT_359285 [Schizothecium conicum]
MSWPPFRRVVDSRSPAVSSVCSGTRDSTCAGRLSVSDLRLEFLRGLPVAVGDREDPQQAFCFFSWTAFPENITGRGRSPRGILGPLADISSGGAVLSSSTRQAPWENQTSMATQAALLQPPRWRYCLPRRQWTVGHTASQPSRLAKSSPRAGSWLPFRLLPQPLPCKVVGPSVHEIDLSSTHTQSEDRKEAQRRRADAFTAGYWTRVVNGRSRIEA